MTVIVYSTNNFSHLQLKCEYIGGLTGSSTFRPVKFEHRDIQERGEAKKDKWSRKTVQTAGDNYGSPYVERPCHHSCSEQTETVFIGVTRIAQKQMLRVLLLHITAMCSLVAIISKHLNIFSQWYVSWKTATTKAQKVNSNYTCK